jgi:polysaccharide export outer membrane protein
MHRKSFSIGICLALAIVALSIQGFCGEPTTLTNASQPAEFEGYIKQLAARLMTNAATPPTNSISSSSSTNAVLIPLDTLDDVHKLALGDRVSYRVIEDKEDPKEICVTDSGELEIPNLGRVPAVGKTCLQLASQIKSVLEKKYYFQATVVLSVDTINKTRGRIYLAGRVRVPGYLDIPADEVFTVSKAILRAGGFGDFADQRHVKVTRKRNGASDDQVITVDVVKILEKGQAGQDLELQPDDRVFVPSKLYNF